MQDVTTAGLIIIAVVVVALATAIAVILLSRRSSIPPAVRDHRRDLRTARRELRAATRAHQRVTNVATQRLRSAEATRRSAIEQARAHLAELEDPRGVFIATYADIQLYELYIATPTGSGPIEGVSAVVDTAGELVVTRRATLTRLAAGGAVLGGLGAILALGFPKNRVEDRRELYLLIEGPAIAHVARLNADDGHKARTFATSINALSRTAPLILTERPQQIEEARRQLLFLEADATEVDRARSELAQIHNSSPEAHAKERAEQQLERLKQLGPPSPPGDSG